MRAAEGGCSGRITIEHALMWAGRQVNELWALLPLCWYHHLGAGLNKRYNEYLALKRATPEDLAKYPKTDWVQKRIYLSTIFGITLNEREWRRDTQEKDLLIKNAIT